MKLQYALIRVSLLLVILAGILLFPATPMSASSSVIENTKDLPIRSQGNAPAKRIPPERKRFALIIGISNYDDAIHFSRLDSAVNDARAMRDALERTGFPEDHITLLTSDQSTDMHPTRKNILKALKQLQASVPEDGCVVLFFAGHGAILEEKRYLLPMDAQVDATANIQSRLRHSAKSIPVLESSVIDSEMVQGKLYEFKLRASVPDVIPANEQTAITLYAEIVKNVTGSLEEHKNYQVSARIQPGSFGISSDTGGWREKQQLSRIEPVQWVWIIVPQSNRLGTQSIAFEAIVSDQNGKPIGNPVSIIKAIKVKDSSGLPSWLVLTATVFGNILGVPIWLWFFLYRTLLQVIL